MVNIIWLVVEPYPSEKYAFVSWDDEISNIWEPSPMWRKGSQQLQRQQKEVIWVVIVIS